MRSEAGARSQRAGGARAVARWSIRALVAAGVVAALAVGGGGCGATTLRVAVGPTLDGDGQLGVEAALSLGIGWPLDYSGRSRHFVQTRVAAGGGRDGRSGAGLFVGDLDVDYILRGGGYLVRAGVGGSLRAVGDAPRDGGARLYGVGGHVAALPVAAGDEGSWLGIELAVGPELRVEYLLGDRAGLDRVLISAPLVLELDLLAIGD